MPTTHKDLYTVIRLPEQGVLSEITDEWKAFAPCFIDARSAMFNYVSLFDDEVIAFDDIAPASELRNVCRAMHPDVDPHEFKVVRVNATIEVFR